MRRVVPFVIAAATILAAASSSPLHAQRTLTVGAYTTPREAYRAILPAFAAQWKQQHGETVRFAESYLGSGAQARAIVAGFQADVAALSLAPDVDRLVKAGLVDNGWAANANRGIVTRSLVVFAVRPGNPKNIRTWDDLAKPGISVLTPNPASSGGAMWNISALVGAALRGNTSVAAGDTAAAARLLQAILRNVKIMDKGARESMLTFEQGVGDVAITYENEVLTARAAGQKVDYVIPPGTIVIENPVAIVRGYSDDHRTTDLARAFVSYLWSNEAQLIFAKNGYRPVIPHLAGVDPALTKPVQGAFTIADLGGWQHVVDVVFSPAGLFPGALQLAKR
jgi:sulfate transport system substrate-binding protein